MQLKIYLPIGINELAINEFLETLVNEYNGCTVYLGKGYWKNSNNKTEIENVYVIEVLTLSSLEDSYAILKQELLKLKQKLKQNCILYSVSEDSKPIFL